MGCWIKNLRWRCVVVNKYYTTIGLIYRCGLHHWESESVWKCLKAPESVIKWNRLYCTCILLALLRIHRSIFERVCCLPKIKTTKGSTVWGSQLNNTGQGLALMAISWKQRISCHVLRIIFGVLCLWCSNDLNVFYLLVLKQFVVQYENVEWYDVLVFANDFLQATRTIMC